MSPLLSKKVKKIMTELFNGANLIVLNNNHVGVLFFLIHF